MAQHLAVRLRPAPFPEPPTDMNPLMQQMQNWLGPNARAIRALAAPLVWGQFLRDYRTTPW